MIRVVLFLLAVLAITAGFAWVADRPGDVSVVWMGYRVETSLMVAALAVGALVVIAIFLWSVLRGLMRSPEQVSLFFRHRRAMKGYLAISRGLVAIGAGDLKQARKSAAEAARLSPGDPLTLLLTAQSAQMSGDRHAAERAFRAMASRDDTKLLGLRGLYVEAQRRDDPNAARQVAEQAVKADPALTWAGQAVLDDRCAAGDWAGALTALEHTKGTQDKTDYQRKRAVLLTARAIELEDSDRDASRAAVLEAVKLAPDLVPAAALAGRRLTESNEQRKARRILDKAWALNPHPDIAEAYANLRLGDSARERLIRMQVLADRAPGHIEGALAVARAALDAREFGAAREALSPYVSSPTRRVAELMAAIEHTEHGDEGRVREWMSRAMRAAGDPAWTADGVVSDQWRPVSPAGRLDGYQWRVPLAEIGVIRPVIELDVPPPPPEEPPAATEIVSSAPELTPSEPVAASEPEAKPEPEVAPEPKPEPQPASPEPIKPAPRVRAAEPVIPLVHAPDDPGPDAGPDVDPVSAPRPQARESWQQFFGFGQGSRR
ncbi:MAG: heme biosynthesis HemY N-terminal domain-containing protein [Pseudolabrys sp.]|nr:heme biosynthesis HemY N-terminal domain-containing protein [Pseudolabrys sp.]